MKSLTLAIESDLGNVSLVSIAVNSICLYAGLAAEEANQVELCLFEAITNSIRHAYHGETSQIVTVALAVRETHLQFDVYDTGTPMSTQQVNELVHGDNSVEIEKVERALIPEGGRGLQIIRKTMDHVAYTQEGGRNRPVGSSGAAERLEPPDASRRTRRPCHHRASLGARGA